MELLCMCIDNFDRYGQGATSRCCSSLLLPVLCEGTCFFPHHHYEIKHLLSFKGSLSLLWILHMLIWFSISLLLFLVFVGFIFILGKIALCYCWKYFSQLTVCFLILFIMVLSCWFFFSSETYQSLLTSKITWHDQKVFS